MVKTKTKGQIDYNTQSLFWSEVDKFNDPSFGDEKVDVLESRIQSLSSELLAVLLKDRTTGRNILWATDNYKGYDNYRKQTRKFGADCEIKAHLVTGSFEGVIKPRTTKAIIEQKKRVKDKAEVFTPSWVCNAQNNLVDNVWLGYDNAFNADSNKSWTTSNEKIDFSKSGRQWQDYVLDKRLEVTCGEAPYLVSRYDTVTGQILEIGNRIGMLDRKIRVINENISVKGKDDKKWIEWVKKAYQSIYGFEWQGDSILIARGNLLYSFRDYYNQRFGKDASTELQLEIAEIISWNIWQMDGLKFVVPNSCTFGTPKDSLFQASFCEEEKDKAPKMEFCEGCRKGNHEKHNGTYCVIKDWTKVGTKEKCKIRFVDCLDKNYKGSGKR